VQTLITVYGACDKDSFMKLVAIHRWVLSDV